MKNLFFFCLLYFSTFKLVFAQAQVDPFNWTEPIVVQSNDIFIQWLESTGGIKHSYQKIYRYKIDSTFLPVDSSISKTLRKEDSRTGGGLYSDAATGKFNIDQYDDVVSIWRGQSGINIMIPQFDTTKSNWTVTIQDSINTIQNDRIYVRTADIDGDSLDEFIIAYLDNEDSVHFNLYDVDSTLHPTLISTFCSEKVIAAKSFQYIRYFIETGDFNGDGTDELVLFATESPQPSTNVRVKIKIFDFESDSIIAKGETFINLSPFNISILSDFAMAGAAGQFKKDSKKEIALISTMIVDGFYYSYNFLLEASSDLQTLTYGSREGLSLNFLTLHDQLGAASGDLNNDGRDEVVFNTGEHNYILATDDNLNLLLKITSNIASGGDDDNLQSYNYIKVKDVNQDNREDIIVVKNFVDNQFADGFFVAIAAADDNLTQLTLLGRLFGDEPQSDTYQQYSIAVGNFDGLDFKIGQPYHYTQNNVVQPLVILNAPPVHFDVLNGQSYDVNECYNGGDCDFFSKYIKQNTTTVEVTTKVHNDWALSAGVGGSGSIVATPLGAGATFNYEAYLLYKHGAHFTNDSTNIRTVTVGVEVQAREDDQIYSTVTDYDLWEYPVFHGNENFPRNTIMTLVPNNVRGQWFPSKSYYALSYIPDHEVGNILSYFPYDTLSNNPNSEQTIKANYVSDSFTLSANTSYDWNLMFNDFTQAQADTTKENGLSFKFSFIVIVQGDFTNTKMTTHRTSVTNQINLKFTFGKC